MKKSVIVLLALLLCAFNPKRKVSIEVYDADVKGVFSMLADMQNLNLVFKNQIKKKVSMKLEGVTWERAIKTLASIADVNYSIEGGILFVFKKKPEKVMRIFELSYSNAKEVADRVSKLLSKDGVVDVDERTNSVIVTDYKENILKIEKFIKQLDKKIKQVLIEAKIVSVDYSHVKDIGIQWGGYYYRTSDGTRVGVSGAAEQDKVSGAKSIDNIRSEVEEGNTAVNLPSSGANSGIFFTLGKLSRSEFYRISSRIMALVEKRKAEILSEPKVVTMDNREASIGQGTEIPYQTVSDKGTKTEFRRAELSLYVKPKVAADGSIFLTVTITRDSMGVMTNAGPTINTQRVQTSLILKNGETAVIGGIVEEDKSTIKNEVPVLSKIPFIGRKLFVRRQRNRGKKEMLIFITPKVIGEAKGHGGK